MKELKLDVQYIGADIVHDLVRRNEALYGGERRRFLVLDLLRDPLPKVDLVLCRDCLVHFSNSDVRKALRNIYASGSLYLLTTTFTKRKHNRSIATGEWRPINLCRPPFNFPLPLVLIEDCYESENYFDKHLGLWKVSDFPASLRAI